MKTGRPHHYLPSPSTVGRDVCQVFVRVQRQIANLLHVSLVSILIMSIVSLSTGRHMKVTLVSQPTHGPHPITMPMLPFQSTSFTTMSRSACFWTSLRLLHYVLPLSSGFSFCRYSPTLASTLPMLSAKSLKSSSSQRR
jgi:hypothetical protein